MKFGTKLLAGCNITEMNFRPNSNVRIDLSRTDSAESPTRLVNFQICFANVEDCSITMTSHPWLKIIAAEKLDQSDLLNSWGERQKNGRARMVKPKKYDFLLTLEGGGNINILASKVTVSLLSEIPRAM